MNNISTETNTNLKKLIDHLSAEDYNGFSLITHEDDAVDTRETLEDFENSAKNHWNEWKGKTTGTICGFPFIEWQMVRARKGDTRRPVAVVDIGDCRIVFDIEISERADG